MTRLNLNWLEAPLIFGLAFAIRLVELDHTGFYDEFYHVLAAKSWVEDGTLSIGEGEYNRAYLYTLLLGWIFWVFDESLQVARMPSVIAGSLLVAVVFVWTRRVVTRGAAWAAALLLCFSPLNLYLSQIARFYAIHALFFFAGCIAVYYITASKRRASYAMGTGIAALVFFALAFHLQVTTIIGLVGLGLWLFQEMLSRSQLRLWNIRKHALFIWFAILLVGGLIAAELLPFEMLWSMYSRWTALWMSSTANAVAFYHFWFFEEYSILWSLFPIAILFGCATSPRPALFCSLIFLTAIGFHSFAAAKHGRYIAYLLPFFFILWGITIQKTIPWLFGLTQQAYFAIFPRQASELPLRLGQVACLVVVIAFFLATLPGAHLTYRMLTFDDSEWPKHLVRYRGESEWERAASRLKKLSANADVVLSSAGVKALYYLGRLDFELSKTTLFEAEPPEQFGIDGRTGRMVVSSADSLQRIMSCHTTGLVIVEAHHWRNPWSVTSPVADLLEKVAEPVELPHATRLIALTWDRRERTNHFDCTALTHDLIDVIGNWN